MMSEIAAAMGLTLLDGLDDLIEHNRVTFADSTGKVHTQFGKTVTIWRKDATGAWKCVVDIWNDDSSSSQ